MDNNHLMNASAAEFSTLLNLAGFRYWTTSLLPALVGTVLPFWLRPPGFSFRLFAAIEFLLATVLVHAGFSFLLAACLLGVYLNGGLTLHGGVPQYIFIVYGIIRSLSGHFMWHRQSILADGSDAKS